MARTDLIQCHVATSGLPTKSSRGLSDINPVGIIYDTIMFWRIPSMGAARIAFAHGLYEGKQASI
jgi:hypothetical protein